MPDIPLLGVPFQYYLPIYRSQNSPLCSLLHFPVASSLLGPNTFLSALFSNTNLGNQVQYPNKTIREITVRYTLSLNCWTPDCKTKDPAPSLLLISSKAKMSHIVCCSQVHLRCHLYLCCESAVQSGPHACFSVAALAHQSLIRLVFLRTGRTLSQHYTNVRVRQKLIGPANSKCHIQTKR